MPTRWKRFTASLLLLLVTMTVGASAGALLCSDASARAGAQPAHVAIECAPGADDCLFLPLAKVAATPALLAGAFVSDVVPAAYVRPLVATPRYRNDADPPDKPPPA